MQKWTPAKGKIINKPLVFIAKSDNGGIILRLFSMTFSSSEKIEKIDEKGANEPGDLWPLNIDEVYNILSSG